MAKYDRENTLARLAGLLTVPSLQANTFRVETAVHLAAAFCRGNLRPGIREIGRWLNRELRSPRVAWSEDPVEDVFVSNVRTPEGNRRIFEGAWSANDYYAQIVIETISGPSVPTDCGALLNPVSALLKLSEHVAERLGLNRWHAESSMPQGKVKLPSEKGLQNRARSVTFTDNDLEALHITREDLAPFVLRNEDRRTLANETIWHTSIERRPLVDFGDKLVLTLPHAVSPAIIRFVLAEILRMGHLPWFSATLGELQAQQTLRDGILELSGSADWIKAPEAEGRLPSFHGGLLKHDGNKYLHVVLLHDRLDWLNAQGLSSYMVYPTAMEAGLQAYLRRVADYCVSEKDCIEGTTLLVLGGLGRGFNFRFDPWPNRQRLSVIRLPDLLMLACESNRSVTRYLKFIKQKIWAEAEGVEFVNLGGDYNFYCCWRRSQYQLVPRELSLETGSMLTIMTDYMAPVREEIRKLTDFHALQTTDGYFVPVRRHHTGGYFKSLQERPIYVSVPHLKSGTLAGVVETTHGAYWFRVSSLESDDKRRGLHFRIWRDFIDLYDRLVSEAEILYPGTQGEPVEINLDLTEVFLPEDLTEHQTGAGADEPVVTALHDQHIATIRLPANFWEHFQQSENTGEKWFVRSIAKGLVGLLEGPNKGMPEDVVESLTNTVIRDSGMRVLHVFELYDPVERLLRKTEDEAPNLLAPEDYAFTNLKLSEGCVPAEADTAIVSKVECNAFLHRVVDKVWSQLRERLQQFERASVIREVLRVQEAVIHDRGHWSRTAQAVIALYSPAEDVFAVAEEREGERVIAGLSARTLLEMAVCECPQANGRQLSRWELDELMAKVRQLHQVAAESDAVNDELANSRIELHSNGEYSLERSFYATVMKPFLAAHEREGFKTAANKYSEWYQTKPPDERRRADEIYSSGFISAFEAEFGLTLNQATEGFAELLDLAIESDSVVTETTLGVIKDRLASNRGFSLDVSEAFLRAFSIFHRPEWDKPPQGFLMQDIEPWRFSRRLAVIIRPLLIFGDLNTDKAFYGVGSLRLGFSHLLDRIEEGHLPQTFFSSEEMRQYIGSVSHEKGHAFARSVSDQLGEEGWQTRVEVQMTELGAPAEFGDVDVLAWKPSGEIWIVECKRLQFARTIGEVAEICRRFRGETKDELDKHLKRLAWIKANPGGLQPIVGFLPNPCRIDDRLVTNTHVPMTYLSSLPIEAGKIGPLE